MMIFLWNFLKEKQNEVKFFTFNYNKDLFWKDINFEIETWNSLQISYKIRKFDYIFIWNSPMQFVWVLSKLLFFTKAKLIWWHHHYPWYYTENTGFLIFLKKFLEKRILKFIDTLVANSIYIQKSAEKIYNHKFKLLYPVLDEKFLNYKNYKISDKPNTIFSYARWSSGKNLEQIFQTYDYLKPQIKDLKIIIWWIWEELDFYKSKYKFDDRVKFLGLLDTESIITNLEKSKVFLFTSKIDSFWLVVLEAMSIWVPVVSSSLTWTKEIITNGQNWFLSNSKQDFQEKVLSLLNNKDLYEKIRTETISIKKQFSHYNFEKQLDSVFLEK